jgi:galactokinase/mevalonate kinase-like predicted kinase
VLNDIRSRYEKGDAQVIETLQEIASLAEKGKQLLIDGDLEGLNILINRNFDLRRKIMRISESNLELITTARNCGASAKFAGSGGSVVGFYNDNETLTRLIIEMKKIKARVIKPFVFLIRKITHDKKSRYSSSGTRNPFSPGHKSAAQRDAADHRHSDDSVCSAGSSRFRY